MTLLPDLVSVIMATKDPLQERTQRALQQLAKSTVPYELILLNRNHSWTTGTIINQGIAAAVGGYVAFCCDDCFVEPEALEQMKLALQDQSVGVVGALLRYPDNAVQHAGGEIRCVQSSLGIAVRANVKHLAHYEPMRDFVSEDVDFVTGALMMTRRDVLDVIGWYDERCELAWGDVDFCLRARQHGYRIRFVAEATATHLEGSTRGSRQGRIEWFFENWGAVMIDNQLRELAGGRSKWN